MHLGLQTDRLDLGYLLILVLRHREAVARHLYLMVFFCFFFAGRDPLAAAGLAAGLLFAAVFSGVFALGTAVFFVAMLPPKD